MRRNPAGDVLHLYRQEVYNHHPDDVGRWPLLSSSYHDVIVSERAGWTILVFVRESPYGSGTTTSIPESLLTDAELGGELNEDTIEAVRAHLLKHNVVTPGGGVLVLKPNWQNLSTELRALRKRHETLLGVAAMKIFLSHKGTDKPKVRDFNATLNELGFETWLDEEAMPAGTPLHRGIHAGMQDACAAVFFVTGAFKDETYLSDEVNYAKDRMHADPKFRIITLVLDTEGERNVPAILKPYVYAKPTSDLDALRQILRALPLKVGAVIRR